MKVAIFDAFNGAGGDMIVASLLGLSLKEEDLYRISGELGLKLEIGIRDVNVKGIKAKKVEVSDSKIERSYKEVVEILENSDLDENIKKDAKNIFKILAMAEGDIHGYEYENAVFHEIGSDDAIFDIVCAVTGIRRLIEQGYSFFVNPIRIGSGFVDISHGKYPVPAPATLQILKNSNLEVIFDGEGELLTPTAAAIFSYYCKKALKIPVEVEGIYYGAGSKETEVPNVLRLIVGNANFHDSIVILETNLDDVSGEILGYAFEKMQRVEGVLDVSVIHSFGKKSRPSILLRVIAKIEKAEEVCREIMRLTGTLGVRVIPVYHRIVAKRLEENVKVELGGKTFSVKIKRSEPSFHHIKPDFEDVVKIAEELNRPVIEVYREILARLEDVNSERK